jgi:hypothetical protein
MGVGLMIPGAEGARRFGGGADGAGSRVRGIGPIPKAAEPLQIPETGDELKNNGGCGADIPSTPPPSAALAIPGRPAAIIKIVRGIDKWG